MLVLDTNIISALMAPANNDRVVGWLDRQVTDTIWTTSVSIYEIRAGILILPEGRRKRAMTDAFEMVLRNTLADRVLPYDAEAAEQAAGIGIAKFRSGWNIDINDVMIAGIVVARDARLATRNTKHFQEIAERLVNPWDA